MNLQKGRASDLRKGRVSESGRIYHITFTTYQRKPWFSDFWLGRQVVACLKSQDAQITTLAYVVMPDHIHWLIQIEQKILSDTVKSFKGNSAYLINKAMNRRGPVWQSGFYDHAIRCDEAVISIARYIVMNPVRAGLVKSVREYPLWDAVWLE